MYEVGSNLSAKAHVLHAVDPIQLGSLSKIMEYC